MSTMRKIFLISASLALLAVTAALGYGAKGWYDAGQDAEGLKAHAQAAIAAGRGAKSLQPERLRLLLQIQDPGFYDHSGIDFLTPGAGLTTLTQSLAKRLAFESFAPGIAKIRQSGYALGLDRRLSKDQQIALFLETAQMGQSRQGWVVGFHQASNVVFGAGPNDITDDEFIALVAVLIAPGRLKLSQPGAELKERIRRISRLAKGQCSPLNAGDVWLNSCK